MTNIQICFSPELFPLFSDRKSIVVVVDVLRATTTMCHALDGCVEKLFPVATVAEAMNKKDELNGSAIYAAERDGKIVKGFDYGNSPQPFLGKEFKTQNMVLTTTNGTRMINMAKNDHEVIIGSFSNITAITNYLKDRKEDVIICCSGWKGKFCIEDTLFAGALAKNLLESKEFEHNCDSVLSSVALYNDAESDLYGYLETSSHRKRLKDLSIEEDVKICVSKDLTNVVPVLKGAYLVNGN
ncbi:MAG: 2-phosphosulfolactate phosphatase [Flavobacteriales bacterium]|jgi:2-phosphosulfolactate phosphatase|nr:2-phosphosulfolactate phosphatase [Flavobacteriales bacterium]